MKEKDKDIAATNRLLEVIRGKRDFESLPVDSEPPQREETNRAKENSSLIDYKFNKKI